MNSKLDCAIVGGGVIGLSLAYELAQRGLRVSVLDKRDIGQEASWAGAGILPPAGHRENMHPYDRLAWLAFQLHPQWAEQLQEQTGIDTGFRPCGGLYVARTPGDVALLRAMQFSLEDEGIVTQALSSEELRELEPAVGESQQVLAACRLPDEKQLRNPDHLHALLAACEALGVRVETQVEVVGWETAGQQIRCLQTTQGKREAANYCFTSGAWTGQLLRRMHVTTGIMPIRGQIIQYEARPGLLTHIVNEGPRYIVPRDDGLVLVGSTEEEAGFDKSTTAAGLADLEAFATSIIPRLKGANIVRRWAGLRPGAFDGFPYLGRLPDLPNGFVAAGHFRSGLFLSPATAQVMSELILDEPPQIDLTPFRVGRG